MTDLQKMYVELRVNRGIKHRDALLEISKITGIDEGSVSRALARAKREDEREVKRTAKKEASHA